LGIIFGNSFKHSIRFRYILAYDILGLTSLRLSRHSQPGLSDHLYLYDYIDFSVLPMAAHIQLDRIKAQSVDGFAVLLNSPSFLEKTEITY